MLQQKINQNKTKHSNWFAILTFPDCISVICCRIYSSDQFHHFILSRKSIVSWVKRFLIGFAGTPPTIVYGGMSFVTTARVPITAPSPIVTPAKMTAS